MNLKLASGIGFFLGVIGLSAQTSPIYLNSGDYDMSAIGGPTNAPQVDATVFINQALFNLVGLGLPYDTQSTLYFTNKSSGDMRGFVGFRFDFVTNSTSVTSIRGPAAQFHNQGKIYGDLWVSVEATNIFSPGTISAGPGGKVSLVGKEVNVARGFLRAGLNPDLPNPYAGLGYDFGGTYENAPGVTDLYWGTGTNNNLGTNGQPFNLQFVAPFNFEPPSVNSPTHQVLELSPFGGNRPFTNVVSLPSFLSSSFGQYTATAVSNWLSPTSSIIQVVFTPTNTFQMSNNISTQVRFGGGFFGAATPMVEISAPAYDVILQTNLTNSIYIIDNSATATNFTYSIGQDPDTLQPTGTRRPRVYDVVRETPFDWFFASGPNIAYTNTLFYNTNFVTNVVHFRYAAYSASVDENNDVVFGGTTGVGDPTNLPGRVEIVAEQLDLTQSRIRAEQFLSIKATNLIGNRLAVVDSPIINYDLGSTNSVLPISNLVNRTTPRMSGQIFVWSAVWTNQVVESNIITGTLDTNFFKFHIMMVDSQMIPEKPVILNEFAARGSNVVIYDRLQIQKFITVDADNLRLAAVGTNLAEINLPANTDLTPASIPRLQGLTNEGRIVIPQTGYFFRQLATNDVYLNPVVLDLPIQNFVNSGMITGASHVVIASNFVNSGTWVAGSGAMNLKLTNGTLAGGLMSSRSDLTFLASNLTANGSAIDAGGTLILDVTNRLADGGPAANNTWAVSDGFALLRRPQSGDLLGTMITTRAAYNALITHSWSAENRGVSPTGYSNNAAIGRLVLDGQPLSLMRFSGIGTNDALYVDYLEFKGHATNITTALEIAPNLTIYFADANLSPDKLNGAFQGRLKWVYNYAGANSTTNIVVDGRAVPMNTALIQSAISDLDADGIPNRLDSTPLLSGSSLDLKITYATAPAPAAQISWHAIRQSTSYVEYRTDLVANNWLTLTNLVQGPNNGRLMVVDPAGALTPRYYRVRVEPFVGLLTP